MSSLLDHVFVEAHDPQTGKVSVDGLRRVFALSTGEIAGVAGVTPRAIRQNTGSARVQARLTRFVDVMSRVRRLVRGDLALARIWLRAPHPDLAMQAPVALLAGGDFDAVERLLHGAETSGDR